MNCKKTSLLLTLFLFALTLASCLQKDLAVISAHSRNHFLQAVVEIPAGTNHKIEYDRHSKEFMVNKKNGRDRIIDFLPYPGNYGFIPSTYMDPAKGGDGDALDVLIIAESYPTGTVMEIIPIAVLLLTDSNEIDHKIIAIPADLDKRIIRATNFKEFNANYPQAKAIIQDWFLNYKGGDEIEFDEWKDERFAKKEIERWMVK